MAMTGTWRSRLACVAVAACCLGASGGTVRIVSVTCSGEAANGAVAAKVVVTNLTDAVQRVSLSGTILDHAAGQESLKSGAKGVDGNDCNALNARNAAEGGVVISGYKAKLKPRAARTIEVAETVVMPKSSPASYDMKLILYDAKGECDSRMENFRFKESKEGL